uniref:accessory gene regulator B family protein n=1 Tax=Agathobacter sp. TaxID=2021311 RepID=UPI0040562C58
METLKQHLKEKYHLSNYQIAQLIFLAKTFFSEASKILIMGIIFHKQLPLYFFALFIMLLLRCSTGGLHFYTYTGCLVTSVIYVWLAIVFLPNIKIPFNIKLLLLLICAIVCYHIGPVPSKYRPPFRDHFIQKCKSIVSSFIFFYSLFLYVMPESTYSTVGFWIIILHSLQLLIAKYTRKEPLK